MNTLSSINSIAIGKLLKNILTDSKIQTTGFPFASEKNNNLFGAPYTF